MLARLRSLYFLIKSTKNWIEVLKVRYGNSSGCEVVFRNGYKFALTKKNWDRFIIHTHLFALMPSSRLTDQTIEFNYKNKDYKFAFGPYGFDTVFEVFAFDPYKDFMKTVAIKGKHVLDVGAAFGDTAVYFLTHGASKVTAVEAFPPYFKLADENIHTNKLTNSINVIKSAVGGTSGELTMDTGSMDMFAANMKETSKKTETVPMVTLTELVNKLNINDGFLKLDTEGFEYDIMLKTPKEVMRKFSDMLIEYHYGYEQLEKYLADCGYTFYHTGPTEVIVPYLKGESQKMQTGHIVAKRVDL